MAKNMGASQIAWLSFVGLMIANICACVNDTYAQSNNSRSTPGKTLALTFFIWDQCFAMEQSLRIE
jgi:hypothetical protein